VDDELFDRKPGDLTESPCYTRERRVILGRKLAEPPIRSRIKGLNNGRQLFLQLIHWEIVRYIGGVVIAAKV
jgi:hypothetical protein